MFHGTCPHCGEPALYGNILSAAIITATGSDEPVQELGQTQAYFVCPNNHTFPMLEVIEGGNVE